MIFLPLWISGVVTSLSFREQKTIHTYYYVCCNQSHRHYLLGDTRLLHLQKSRSKEKVRYCLICFREMCLRDDDVMSGKTTDARFSSSRTRKTIDVTNSFSRLSRTRFSLSRLGHCALGGCFLLCFPSSIVIISHLSFAPPRRPAGAAAPGPLPL